MIEFTFADIVLLAWAILASGFAASYQHQLENANEFIHALIHQDGLRDDIAKKMKANQ